MADEERRLVSKCAATGGVEELVSMGIQAEHFADTECQAIFETCRELTRRYGAPPSYETVRGAHQDFNFEVVSDTLRYCADEFVKVVKRREGVRAIRELADVVDDPSRVSDIDAAFLEASRNLARVVPSDRAHRLSDMHSRIELWKKMKQAGTFPGIPMGIPTFDAYTLGVQPYEFVSIVGWQGTGKSTLLQYVMLHAYLNGRTPMLVSLEMQADALYRKWDVMLANASVDVDKAIAYHDLKSYTLKDDQIRRLEDIAKRIQGGANDIIVLDGIGRCTVDKVYAETVRYKPDIVGVDYISLMDAPRNVSNSMWEKVTYLTQNFKMMSRSLGTPMYGIAQTNIDSADEGAMLSNIAYSRSIGQDSDLVFGLSQRDEQRANKQMTLRMLKNRDGVICSVDMLWDMEIMKFREFKEVADMFQRKHTP